MRFICVLIFFITPVTALADQVVEGFATVNKFSGGTAIWNQALGVVHAKLRVLNYNAGAPTPVEVDVGDGSDGAFVLARYAEFSENGDLSGNKIRLNRTRPLNVTEFVLEDDWILEPVADYPLIIRSLSDVKILGEIWCHGHPGVTSVGTAGGVGGAGRCGGEAGGVGGSTTGAVFADGDPGGDASAPVTGGEGGTGNGGGAGMGGGGGGSWNLATPPISGPLSTGVPGSPGALGTSMSDPSFSFIGTGVGGGGGGGGGGGAGSTGPGGGGGAGGGVVIIHAVRDFELGFAADPLEGYIFANGGNGADSTGNGGGGAGGGGGSIQVFAGGTIRIYSNPGVGSGQAVGGRNPVPNAAAFGGTGRNWFTSIAYMVGGGYYDPLEEGPTVIPGDNVHFAVAPQYVESKSYDLHNTLAEVTAVNSSPASGDFALQWSGSSDNFTGDDTGWSTSLPVLNSKRFIKFRFTVTNSVSTAPVFLDSITFVYASGRRTEFDFKSASGCARVNANGGGSPWSAGLILLPILWLAASRYRRHC